MTCPTCDHTMQCLEGGHFGKTGIHWCPRCGTIYFAREGFDDRRSVPMLVERCGAYEAGLKDCRTPSRSFLISDWRRLGIAEAINTPENRS
jgi:hypothetical protein